MSTGQCSRKYQLSVFVSYIYGSCKKYSNTIALFLEIFSKESGQIAGHARLILVSRSSHEKAKATTTRPFMDIWDVLTIYGHLGLR